MFEDDTDLKRSIDAFVNPLTALCLRRIVMQNEHRSVIIDGASCHLGRSLIQLLKEADVEVIALFRDQNMIQDFNQKLGESMKLKYALGQNAQDFEQRIQDAIKEVNPLMYISCVGGDLTGKVFKFMPNKSQLVVIGNLSNQDLCLPITELFMEGK